MRHNHWYQQNNKKLTTETGLKTSEVAPIYGHCAHGCAIYSSFAAFDKLILLFENNHMSLNIEHLGILKLRNIEHLREYYGSYRTLFGL